MKKYKTETWLDTKIVEVEVDRETESSVWIKGRRLARKASHDIFHDSWGDAYDYLLRRAEAKVESYVRQLEVAKSKLDMIKRMEKPN